MCKCNCPCVVCIVIAIASHGNRIELYFESQFRNVCHPFEGYAQWHFCNRLRKHEEKIATLKKHTHSRSARTFSVSMMCESFQWKSYYFWYFIFFVHCSLFPSAHFRFCIVSFRFVSMALNNTVFYSFTHCDTCVCVCTLHNSRLCVWFFLSNGFTFGRKWKVFFFFFLYLCLGLQQSLSSFFMAFCLRIRFGGDNDQVSGIFFLWFPFLKQKVDFSLNFFAEKKK